MGALAYFFSGPSSECCLLLSKRPQPRADQNGGMSEHDPVRSVLTRLLACLRDAEAEVSAAEAVLSFAVPEDLREPTADVLYLGIDQAEVFREARSMLAADLRFEHLTASVTGDPLQDALVRFACLCEMNRATEQIAPFFAEHYREPQERLCFIGVEYLQVSEPFNLFGVRLLPVDHAEVPDSGGFFKIDPPVGAVVAVPTEGTHLALMKDRGAAVA